MIDAAKQTNVPMVNFCVDSMREYNALVAMSTALPNIQQITLRGLGQGHKYSDGEDPRVDRAASTANQIAHDINFISRFRKLRVLKIVSAPLNGRYPVLFNNFPLLQKLVIDESYYLKFDLDMLAGSPLLKELSIQYSHSLAGNISSLRVLKDTIEKVVIKGSSIDGEGNFMDLADFPNLKKLDLQGSSSVTGDIRSIGEHDFLAMEDLTLPDDIWGGSGFEFQRVSDAAGIISTLYPIMKQRPVLLKRWFGELSRDSPDWYAEISDDIAAPIFIEFVQAGSRVGYHWYAMDDIDNLPCEVIWLDPEPDRESNDYETYIEELQEIENAVDVFEGFEQPPNEDEYFRRCAERFDYVEYVDGEVYVH
mmetsp:Transcript_5847/g.8467  ORF Transcript_5847/g.8467 Transcript_5847/m.8467 type:complete len:365 (-) Transcript_5847:152-1246(-)